MVVLVMMAMMIGMLVIANMMRREQMIMLVIFIVMMVMLIIISMMVMIRWTMLQDIMHEIRTQGPVEAVMEVYTDFFMYTSGVYQVLIQHDKNTISTRTCTFLITENKPSPGSSCRLPCCQDHWLGTGAASYKTRPK